VPVDHALEQEWQQARLIPTAGIRGQEEQEVRAASALLAVIPAVPQFGQAVLKPMKAPKGNLRTYTEVRLKDRAGKLQTPDGAIVVERGKRRWACVVEFKTGRSRLDGAQIERYLDAARQAGFDGLLTISNEITADRGPVPFDVDKRKVGALALHHLSWWDVLTEAILQHQFRGVTDPDQAYILGELVRYLTDERSGASGFQGMGDAWTKVREGARQGTLRQNDPGVREVAARWEQLVKYLCLTLSQELGVMVSPQFGRGQDARRRLDRAADLLASEGILRGSFRVPDAVGPVTVDANVEAGMISASLEMEAPTDVQRPIARINWLLRQIDAEATEDLRIGIQFVATPGIRTRTLAECREEPKCLLLPEDPRRDPRSFVLTQSRSMGRRSGRGGVGFVAETRELTTDFYRDLVQELRPPRPKAPRLPKEEAPEQPAPTSEEAARREHLESFDVTHVAPTARV
jgi:hypothetical protein